MGIEDKRIWLEDNFWYELRHILEDTEPDDLVDWFLKVLTKLFRDNPENLLNDFLTIYNFKQELLNFITSFFPDFENIYILGNLNNSFVQNNVQIAENISDSREQDYIGENNVVEVIDGRLKGKFVSQNVINLSTRILSKA